MQKFNAKTLSVLIAGLALLALAGPAKAQNRGLSAQPYVSDQDSDPVGEVSSSFLTTTGLPLQLTFTPEGDDTSLLQGGVILQGFSPHSVLTTFEVDELGPADSTHGPFIALIGSAGDGDGDADDHPVNLRVALSTLPHRLLKNGYTRYYYFTPASLHALYITSMGVYVQANEETSVGPYLLNNFEFNDVQFTKIMSTSNLSPNLPF